MCRQDKDFPWAEVVKSEKKVRSLFPEYRDTIGEARRILGLLDENVLKILVDAGNLSPTLHKEISAKIQS